MQIITKNLSDGNKINYQIVNGTAYHVETKKEVIDILENARINHNRIRIFYGDTKTGKDWHEEYDVMGTIDRSTGKIKIPLLIKNNRSLGGTAILDHCIVKITIDKRTVYKQDNYYLGTFNIKECQNNKDYPFMVFCDDKNIANFKTQKQAVKYIDFLKGERNKI